MLDEIAETRIYLKEEWHVRRIVMEGALEELSDGEPHTSQQILDALIKRGLTIPKRLVNSVLFSEARRYVSYDKKTFTYRLRQITFDEIDGAVTNIDTRALQQNEPPDVEGEIKARYIGRNDEYVFSSSTNTGPTFFDTSAKSRTIEIALNQNHPMYESLRTLLDTIDDLDCEQLRQRILQAQRTVEVMLAAWSRYENDLPNGPRKFKAEEMRSEWGRNARLLLMDSLDEEE